MNQYKLNSNKIVGLRIWCIYWSRKHVRKTYYKLNLKFICLAETYGSARIISKNLFGANGSQDANETQTILESIGANKTVLVERDHSIVVLELIRAHLEEGIKQLALTVQDMKIDEELFEYSKVLK